MVSFGRIEERSRSDSRFRYSYHIFCFRRRLAVINVWLDYAASILLLAISNHAVVVFWCGSSR